MEGIYKTFIVEDDELYNKLLVDSLSENKQLKCESYFNGKSVLKKINQNPDFIILDYRLPDLLADEIIQKFKSYNPTIKIVIVSSQTDIKVATSLIKMGADDYIIKDEHSLEHANKIIKTYIKEKKLIEENSSLKNQFQNFIQLDTFLIGHSNAISNIKKLIIKASQSALNIAIVGENGTGKRYVAKVIHMSSKLSHLPLNEIGSHDIENFEKYIDLMINNITKIPENLAIYKNGTYFIEEIGDLNLTVQTKLMLFLKKIKNNERQKEYTASSSHRLIIGSKFNMHDLLKKKKLNEELYFETLGLKIELPPLRDRAEDIAYIAEEFKNEFCRSNNTVDKKLSNGAKKKLLRYNYPGNVKELRAIIELACVLSEGSAITEDEIVFNSNLQSSYDLNNTTLKDFTARYIFNYLKRNDFQVVKTANVLGISKSKIYKMLNDGSFDDTKKTN